MEYSHLIEQDIHCPIPPFPLFNGTETDLYNSCYIDQNVQPYFQLQLQFETPTSESNSGYEVLLDLKNSSKLQKINNYKYPYSRHHQHFEDNSSSLNQQQHHHYQQHYFNIPEEVLNFSAKSHQQSKENGNENSHFDDKNSQYSELIRMYNEPTNMLSQENNFLLQIDDNQQVPQPFSYFEEPTQQVEQKQQKESTQTQGQSQTQTPQLHPQQSQPQPLPQPQYSFDSKKFGNYFTSLACSILTPIEIDKIRIGVKKIEPAPSNTFQEPSVVDNTPKWTIKPKKKRVYSEQRECSNCKTTNTPLWRQTRDKKIVCNACGLYLRSNKQSRPKKLNDHKKNDKKGIPTCTNCSTRTTPIWRRDQNGNLLCNACGLYLKSHKIQRPYSEVVDSKKFNHIQEIS